MEITKEKFRINDYVVYKDSNEWHEGRINSIQYEESGERYNITSLHTFTEISIKNHDFISNTSPEMRRKMKSHIPLDTVNKIHFPLILKHILVLDKESCAQKIYELPHTITVTEIVKAFTIFFRENNGSNDEDEIGEVYKAFIHSFDTLLSMFLLYENEIEQYKLMKEKPSETYGFIHFLRLLYYLQKEGIDLAVDNQTKTVILDYTIYMLDFLVLKYKEFYY